MTRFELALGDPGHPGETAENPHGGRVEVRAGASPLLHDEVDGITHTAVQRLGRTEAQDRIEQAWEAVT